MKKRILRFVGYGSLFYVVLSTIHFATFFMSKRYRELVTEGITELKKDADKYIL